ncbi:MAG: hypothetical protein OER80_01000 [Gammaproteobacteria bacterium]|nr:hypothetical protein [Gammaproteobacteria bacterium]
MLREIKAVHQSETDRKKRWFSDLDFDLIVWQKRNGTVSRFELSFDKGMDEHALTWKEGSGLKHYCVDDGENRPMRHKMSPLLGANGPVDYTVIERNFGEVATGMDVGIADFIKTQLILGDKKSKN